MEEKMINEQESLELISQMIQKTKTNLGKGAGNDFLIWGYACLVATAVVLIMADVFHVRHAGWAYFLIPILGFITPIVIRCIDKDALRGRATTYIAKSLKALYGSCSLVFFCYIVMGFLGSGNPKVWLGAFFLGCFVPSFCAMVAGTLMRMKIINCLGIVSMAVSLAILTQFLKGECIGLEAIACSVVVWLCSLVIPGHILNHEANKALKR